VLFGGKPLKDHSIPDCYGSYEPTAVELSIKKITKTKVKTFFKELFGPF
jgi:1-pyrroline-5-carboxylate dehydrogenase